MVHKHFCINGIPTRLIIGIMIFMACLFSYMLRVNMSINLIAMVQPTLNAVSGKANVPECLVVNNMTKENETHTIPDYGVRYSWDQGTQGLILGSYFWGYILTAIPGGLLAERFGPLQVIGISGVLSGLLTILTPPAASIHYMLVIVIRFVMGFFGGVVYPALHCLISRWAPPTEKGKFAGALFGGNFGTVITWPVLGAVSEHMGWSWSFYLPGILCLVWCASWYIFVSDSPKEHKRINPVERDYIIKGIGNSVTQSKCIPPYLQIFKSIPFLALTVLHFGNLWGLYFLMTAGPKFMAEVLGFELTRSGGLAALPYLARMTMGFAFGALGDAIRARKWLTVTSIRKWFIICSHIIPGLLLLALTLTGCNVYLAVVLLTLSLGFNGASAITNIQNSQDLAPNFAGTLYGIINCIGGTTGFITPILTGYMTREHNGMTEWHKIFSIGATVYLASGVFFCVFGSGETQPWNSVEVEERKEDIVKGEEQPKGVDNKAFDGEVDSVANGNNSAEVNTSNLDNTKV